MIMLAAGVLVTAILGLFAYMNVTATPLHPDPQSVPSVTHSTAPPHWANAVEQGRQLARAGLIEQNLPGLSVTVGGGDDIVWAEGFGYADLEKKVPVGPEMRFRIAEVSNALTSAAVGLLLEKHKLNLDEEIQAYVPEFPKKHWPVTLRQVMGHLAGIRNDEGDEEPLSVHCERTVDGLQRFARSSLLFEPGTEFRSSSYGWILVSAAVEDATTEPFFTFMRTRIFEPLGMAATRPDSVIEPIADRVTFYFPRFAGDNRSGWSWREGDHSCFAGAGAFLSTPSDLVRFGMAISSRKAAATGHGRTPPDAAAPHVGPADRLRSGLEARDGSARGRAHANGGPWHQGRFHRRDGVAHDVSHPRSCRGRDLEHFVR